MKPIRKGVPLLIIVVAVLLLLGFMPKWYQHSQLEAAVQVANEPPEVQYVLPRKVEDPGLTLPSTINAMEDTVVVARTAGYIKNRRVDIGYRVKRGELLCTIEAPDTDTQFDQAKAQTRQGAATVLQSKAQADNLRAAQLQSMANRLSSVAAVKHAQAAALSAHAQVIAAQRTMDAQHSTVYNDRAQMVFAEREWKRYQTLGQQGFVTSEDVDTKQAAYKGAQGVLDAAKGQEEVARANVNAAEKNYAAAQSDVGAAEANLAAAGEAVNAAIASVRSGEETVSANQESVSALRANEAHFGSLTGFERVLAPFDGVIETRSVDNGFLVDPTSASLQQTGLFEIGRTDTLRIAVQVPQTYYGSMRKGLQADVMVRELPGRKFAGTVFTVAGGAAAATRTFLSEVEVANPSGVLIPGMYAEVHFAAMNRAPVLRVPSTALVIDALGTRVATIDGNDKIHFVAVTLGRDYGVEAEILTGVKARDRILNNPNDDMVEGLAVKPQELPHPAGSGAPAGHASGAPQQNSPVSPKAN